MYKTALAALALALSFGLNTSVFAQTTSDQQGQGQNQTQTSDQKTTDQKTADQKADQTTDQKKAAAPAPAKPAAPAAPVNYVQTYGWTKTGAPVATAAAAQAPRAAGSKAAGAAGAKAAAQGTTTSTKSSKKDEIVVIQQSPDKMYVSKNNKWQTFKTYISLKPGQETLPLTMTVTNFGYRGITMFLSNQKLASDKDFKSTTLTMQMTGALSGGDNDLTIQGLGAPGSNLSWKLTTKRPVITGLSPTEGVIESEVKISGRNFSKTASANRVLFGKLAADSPIFSGKDLVIKVPKEAPGGKTNIVVEIGGIASKPAEFLVKFAPEVTNVDLLAAPPGQQLTVTGKGFSPVRGENQVTIGGAVATIVSESATSITCIVPELQYPTWATPVVVKSGGVESKKNGALNIQMRVIPNDGVPQQ